MAIEKKLAIIGPLPFTANGASDGTIQVSDTVSIKVYATVVIKADTLPNLRLQVKEVVNKTELVVGPIDKNLGTKADLSLYTTALNATIEQPGQTNLDIPRDQWERSVYEQEPTLAKRQVMVDPYGNFYTLDNPFPVQIDGDIIIGSVAVDITDKESSPGAEDYDIIRIGDGEDELEINPDGSINVNVINSLPDGTQLLSIYNEISSVATNLTTNILSYTIPMGSTAELEDVNVSGDNIAKYELLVNGNVVDKKRTYFGGNLNEVFDFKNSIVLVAGDIITVRVNHIRPDLGDFNARLMVLQKTI